MVKKYMTSSEYTKKYQDRLHSIEKLKKVLKQKGDSKLLQAQLRFYKKIVLKRQNEHRRLYLQWYKDNKDKVDKEVGTPSFKRWHAPQKMREIFPEVFTDLKKCPDCKGKFYLMSHQDWYDVLKILDMKKWGLNYDCYKLEHEHDVHVKAIEAADKEFFEAKYCKGVNPQDIDQAELFGADRIEYIDEIDNEYHWSKVIIREYLEREKNIKV